MTGENTTTRNTNDTERCWCWLVREDSGYVNCIDSMSEAFIDDDRYDVTIAWWPVKTGNN